MKRIVLAAVALAALPGLAHAADTYASLYGNTLNMVAADGSKATAFLNADMSWEQHLADGTVLKGTYAWKDAQTACFTQTDPAPKTAAPNCIGGQVAHNVGDTWTITDGNGKTSTLSITQGR